MLFVKEFNVEVEKNLLKILVFMEFFKFNVLTLVLFMNEFG